MRPEDVDMVVTHGNCPDGYGAAWCAWKKLGKGVEYYFASYNGDKVRLPDVKGKNVLMVDFAYKDPNIMNFLDNMANDFLLLDHHEGAMKALDGKISCNYEFDMDRSGARMAWDFFFPGKLPPHLILYIEDRDIWKWEMKEARAYLAALETFEPSFQEWDRIASLKGQELEDFFNIGRPIVKYQENLVKSVSKSATPALLKTQDGKHSFKVNAVNSNSREIVSDLGHRLAEMDPEIKVGIVWHYSIEDELFKFSVRTVDGVNANEIANCFGGGGHPGAAGFETKNTYFPLKKLE